MANLPFFSYSFPAVYESKATEKTPCSLQAVSALNASQHVRGYVRTSYRTMQEHYNQISFSGRQVPEYFFREHCRLLGE